jgi:hypothetical protein
MTMAYLCPQTDGGRETYSRSTSKSKLMAELVEEVRALTDNDRHSSPNIRIIFNQPTLLAVPST